MAREDVAGFDALFEHGHDGGAGADAVLAFLRADGELRAAVGQAHAEGLECGGQGVGGVHAAAGAGSGDGRHFDVPKLGVGQLALGVLADGLEDGDDVEGFLVVAVAGGEAREDGATVDEDGGAVESGDGDHGAGHVFVTAADGDEAVKALGGDGGLDGVGDDLAGNQTVAHAQRAHADAVGDRDGIEIDRLAAGGSDALAGVLAEFAQVDIAGRHVAGSGGDGDLGLLEVLVGKADGAKHGPGGRAVGAVDDDGGEGAGGIG